MGVMSTGAVDARWVVVVECYCFLINIIVGPPTVAPSLLLHKSVVFHFFGRLASTKR